MRANDTWVALPLSTVEPDYNKQEAFQHPDLISKNFDLYGTGKHSNIITCLINNDSEYSPYSYE